jgi:hypothetical protein
LITPRITHLAVSVQWPRRQARVRIRRLVDA